MITGQDITNLFSEAYAKAALTENCDMRQAADLFESIHPQMDISDPYLCWDFIIIDSVKFGNDYAIDLLSSLRESYFNLIFEKLLTDLDAVYIKDKEEGLKKWKRQFALAAVYYRDDLACMLCYLWQKWGFSDDPAFNYSKLPLYLRENRWPEAYPYYQRVAEDKDLDPEVRAFAEITLLEIVLYYYPEYSNALVHLENARSLLPDHFLTKRAEAIYFLKTGEIQKARNGFLQVIALKPGDFVSFDFIGDCFYSETMLESAESWYNEAILKNCLQTDSYKRLLSLYGDKSWFKEKEPLLSGLLDKIAMRKNCRNTSYLIGKNLATEECFISLSLYDCYRTVAAAWSAAGDFDRAEKFYLDAWKLLPSVPTAILELGYVMLDKKMPDKALEYFMQALEADRDYYETNWGLAFYYMDQEDKEKALWYFRECLRIRPDWSGWVNNFIGNMYFSHKDYKESEIYYRKSLETDGNYLVFRQNLAGALEAQADQFAVDLKNEEAEKLYLEAVSIDNNPDRWNEAGNFYFKLSRWAEAAGCYEKAVALRATDPVIQENLGLSYENMQKFGDAENCYRTALDFEKVSGRFLNRMGVFYFDRKRYEEAISFYSQALEREQKNPVFLENICLAYEQLNQADLAEPFYIRLLEIEPANHPAMNLLGNVYYRRGNYEKAMEYFRQAVALDENNGIYQTNLGLSLMFSGLKEQAMEVFQKAVKLKDDYFLSWNDLGVLYYEKGKMAEAIDCYNKAINLQPADPVLFSNLALALNAQGKSKEAFEVLMHPLLKEDVRIQVENMLRENLPALFEQKK
jgi:tetratricopeptide (TPR) repeat protein